MLFLESAAAILKIPFPYRAMADKNKKNGVKMQLLHDSVLPLIVIKKEFIFDEMNSSA